MGSEISRNGLLTEKYSRAPRRGLRRNLGPSGSAVISGNNRICKVLLDSGADADQADEGGDTPRSCAMEDGDKVMKRVFTQSAIPTIHEEEE